MAASTLVRRLVRRLVGTVAPAGVLSAGLVPAACGPSEGKPPAPQDPTAPTVIALSTYSASLGTPVNVYIRGLPGPTQGKVQLHFVGGYHRSDGKNEPVDLVGDTSRIDGATLRWTAFGPFANPFDADPADPATGVFEGSIAARTIRTDGTIVEDPKAALHVVFAVAPSIVIEDFQPTSASCAQPAGRAFAGFHYRLKARAVGFTPSSFVYTLRTPSVVASMDAGGSGPVLQFQAGADGSPTWSDIQVTHAAHGVEDAIAGSEAFLLPPLPQGATGYSLLLTVESTGSQGETVATTLVMYTQNPISFFYDGRYQLAELYPAIPVSSCMPGGPQGRVVTYSDQNTQTVQRTLTLTLSQSFLNSVTHSVTGTLQNTWSTADGKSYARSTTDTSGWATSTTTGTSNTQSSSNTSGTSSTDTNGSMSSNAFTFTGSGSQTTGVAGGISWSNEANGEMSAGDTFTYAANPENVGFTNAFTGSDGTGYANDSGGNESSSMSTTGGWSAASTGTSGSNSSSANTSSNSTTNGSSVTTSVADSNQASGSTASTDSIGATQVDTVGGGSSTATSNGSSASEGTMNASADGWSVSSAETIGTGFSGLVVAGTYGTFYRQMARYTREAFLLEYDKCGTAQVIGEATLQDYTWAPDLAQAATCPPMPATNFPPPQCYLPPCSSP
jgi:hypothetical protein